MDLLAHLGLGFATAITPTNLLYCFMGVFLGTLIGVLPGLGPTATIAMLLAFILDPRMEEYLRRALLLSRGDPLVFVTRPISATLLGLAAVAIVIFALPALTRKREEVFREE